MFEVKWVRIAKEIIKDNTKPANKIILDNGFSDLICYISYLLQSISKHLKEIVIDLLKYEGIRQVVKAYLKIMT